MRILLRPKIKSPRGNFIFGAESIRGGFNHLRLELAVGNRESPIVGNQFSSRRPNGGKGNGVN